ncbi:MAG: hypothetical protein D6737_02155 [Chloroflexi bacterium]|nr:MAG: hypothetical protein CUN54_04820 [Phototrophicales bacterium]RMF82362.1 MAG: hypothetical protein D6737_02155 [Chloroflexota bacterium]
MADHRTFEHRSRIATTAEALFAFHAAPSALSDLMPPLTFVQVLRDDRTSLTDGEFEFRVWFGPIPIRWLANHEPGSTQWSFIDRLLAGPMPVWVHEHTFRDVDGGAELLDHIIFQHPTGIKGVLTRLLFDGMALRLLFIYRHWQTKRKLEQ